MVLKEIPRPPQPVPPKELERQKTTQKKFEAEEISEISPPIFAFVPNLEAKSHIDTVGTVGGLRMYIPARMSRDSQFPFPNDEEVTIRVLIEKGTPVGLLVTESTYSPEAESIPAPPKS